MDLNSEIINQYKKNSKVFIETGTLHGYAVDQALNCNFEEIHTIELDKNWYSNNMCKYYKHRNVNCYKGDSAIILYDVIKEIDKKCFFWLDGHYSGGWTAKGIKSCPLEEELIHISKHHIKDHVILIDDINLCGTEWIIELDVIKKYLYDINQNYNIQIVDFPHKTYLGKPEQILVASI